MQQKILRVKWGTSRGRDTYGYTTCSLYDEHGKRRAACNGGGYDMRGTVLGRWLADEYRDRLLALKPEQMPKNSHWEPQHPAPRACSEISCRMKHGTKEEVKKYAADAYTCPDCGAETYADPRAGRRVDDGRYFYGLTFHDPNYDPGKAIIGKDALDRTFGGAEGETVEQAEAASKSFGLERYQAFYRASSKHATERHTEPSIDGACGYNSVTAIAEAIGLDVSLLNASSRLDIITITDKESE